MIDRREDLGPILFISHDAWRTGAPTALLHFVRWLKSNTTIPFAVVLRVGDGELRADFEAVTRVAAWADLAHPRSRHPRIGLFRRRVKHSGDPLLALLGGRSPSLIYSNTITNGALLDALAYTGAPVITHVHELDFWIRERTEPGVVASTKARTKRFIAASKAVQSTLLTQLGLPASAVNVVYEFVSEVPTTDETAPERVRAELGIPKHAPVVGGIGTTDWRKGVDLFIQLAVVMTRQRPDVPTHFVWVGGERTGSTAAELLHDARQAGIVDRVHLCGKQPSVWPYLRVFDTLALVSREDPYPLAMLEAALAERPIVCFAEAGGAPEFVNDDAGMVVRYLDLGAMADATWQLIDDAALRRTLGRRGAQRVRQQHMVDHAAPEILRIMGDVSGARAAR